MLESTMTNENGRRGLGRGLGSIFGETADVERQAVTDDTRSNMRMVSIGGISANPDQPRKNFDKAALKDLAESIMVKGVLEPILVREKPGGGFIIVAGERRWRAAQLAKLHDIPVVIKDLSDAEAMEIALIENIQREDLNPLEEAEGYQDLMTKYGYTQETVSKKLGRSRSHIANTVRLLTLPETARGYLLDGRLSAGHARAVLSAPHPEALAEEIVGRDLTVREAEAEARRQKVGGVTPPPVKTTVIEKDADIRALEESLMNALGLKISLKHKPDGRGELRIMYNDAGQLDDVCHRLQTPMTGTE